MSTAFDPYHKWLGIPPEEQPADHYRLLGIKKFESDPDVIESGADQRMAHLRTFQSGQYSDLSQKILNEISAAKFVLLGEEKHAYDVQLRAKVEPVKKTRPGSTQKQKKATTLPTAMPLEAQRTRENPASHPAEKKKRAAAGASAVAGSQTSSAAPDRNWRIPGLVLASVAGTLVLGCVIYLLTSSPQASPVAEGDANATPSPVTQTQDDRPTTLSAAEPDNISATTDTISATTDTVEPSSANQTPTTESPTTTDLVTADFPNDPSPSNNYATPASHDTALSETELQPPVETAPSGAQRAMQQQQGWANQLGLDVEMENSIGMKFRLIPPGEFLMGSTQEEIARYQQEAKERNLPDWYVQRLPGEGPQHSVKLTGAFYLGAHEVTKGQFRRFVEAMNYKTDAEKDGKGGFQLQAGQWVEDPALFWSGDPGFAQNDDHPVVNVSWNDAAEFCRWLSEKEGVRYSLPTDAQWEYACRAGSPGRYSFGDEVSLLGEHAWFGGNSGGQTHPVGQKLANAFGLHDMQGNVWEWCQDRYGPFHSEDAVTDPTGPEQGKSRLVRGGSFARPDFYVRSAVRFWQGDTTGRSGDIGFRVIRTCQPSESPDETNPSAPTSPPSSQPQRLAVPTEEEQQRALQAVKEVFAEDLAAAKNPQFQTALAERFLVEGKRVLNEAAERYVLLSEARSLAISAFAPEVAIQSVEAMAAAFEVDAWETRIEVSKELARAAKLTDQRKTFVVFSLQLVDVALDEENYEMAQELILLASGAASRSRDLDLRQLCNDQRKEISEIKQQWEDAEAARTLLPENPDDAKAHLALGRYLCLLRGDWVQGLPHLAKGSDTALKKLAEQDIRVNDDPLARARLAGDWWELSRKLAGRNRKTSRNRAQHWYEQALSKLTGPSRNEIVKRLDEIADESVMESWGPGYELLVDVDFSKLTTQQLGRGFSSTGTTWGLKDGRLIGFGNTIYPPIITKDSFDMNDCIILARFPAQALAHTGLMAGEIRVGIVSEFRSAGIWVNSKIQSGDNHSPYKEKPVAFEPIVGKRFTLRMVRRNQENVTHCELYLNDRLVHQADLQGITSSPNVVGIHGTHGVVQVESFKIYGKKRNR